MAQITLLDGGLGQELVHRSGDKPTPLWSTRVMIDHPGLVEEVHRDFYDAGATVIATNTYALHHDRLELAGVTTPLPDLITAALSEARAARDAHPGKRILGSIGPLIASYRADLHPPMAEATPLYTELAQALAPHVDVIGFETVPSIDAARAALAATQDIDTPIWLAFTLDDQDGSKLRSGEPLADALSVAQTGAAAILANCSAPEVMAAAMDIFATSDLPFGGYANGFTKISDGFLQHAPTVDALTKRQDLGPEDYAAFASKWAAQGATIIGGCCEISPDHIRAVHDALIADGHTII
ncbi:homocysteine S-methyltransferase family protein [Cognatishimia sp. MH4019]|uniref:homocysteine S-methyltransferase family protein n=1 Tax=Cognatishimia sp. MH4019 TaxID=2854030 RepID=UPI001CD4C964|nr:homocysteine S-methyltransferase family protein [Cognatishimia sp. MH4019]